MTLTAKITGRIKIPNLDLSDELLEIANKDVIARMAKNIQQGIDLQERKFDKLDPKTIKAKGHGRPLINTGKLHSSFVAAKRGKNKVLIRINVVRRKIAKFLQIDGIRTISGERKFNFFGVNTRMEVEATKRMEKNIIKRVRNAGR